LAFSLIKNQKWSEGLVIASLLCDEETKGVLIREYIEKFIVDKNPLQTLLLIKIGYGLELLDKGT
jgi:hypothetical protein